MRRAALILAALSAACGAPRATWSARWRAPYATFDDELRVAFAEARAQADAGEADRAWRALDALCAANPDNLELALWRQEAELELLERVRRAADAQPGVPAGEPAGEPLEPPFDPEGEPLEALRRHYLQAVELAPSVAGFVLAARVEPDPVESEKLASRALDLDPRCAWAHYARAHALLRQQWKAERWREAREALDRALELDGSHLRGRRLEAWLDAQEGASERAARELVTWLNETEGDPRVTEPQRIAAELDLAATWILSGSPREARALLATREGEPRRRVRRLALLAVAEGELGDPAAALDAARRAEDAGREELLPLVQQALLFEHGLAQPDAARERWERVAERAAGRGDLAAMMQGLRAQVELERAARAAGR